MFELILGTPFTLIINGPNNVTPLTDTAIYLGGVNSGLSPVVLQVGSTNCWTVTFTPVSTGVYTIYGFGIVQARVQASTKSLYTYLANTEDVALGSWSWDKTTGALTLLRQNGTSLATFTIADTATLASRQLN
jgi:hypothetical protein